MPDPIPAEWIEAGAQALVGGTNYVMSGDNGVAGTMNRLTAQFVIAAVVPMVREQIARDIEAHYTPMNGDVGPTDYDEGLHVGALLARGACGYVNCAACARRGER